ncbi:MAG TPA: gluconokinase [Acidimicrobiales bacterium]|nr:gluconokinase [Acidimicrobiales bacterium]
MREVIIGLDVGTTSTKAVAFALDSSRRSVVIRKYPLLHPGPLQYTQDPMVILEAAASALAECVQTTEGAKVLAVSVSAAMHGLMALDGNWQPLTPLVTWADGRAGDEIVALERIGMTLDLQASTGAALHPMTPFAKLLWFARHDRDVSSKARLWVGLKDYLLYWLSGSFVTELSSASGTGLLDLVTRSWSSLALDLCGLQPSQLPEILSTTSTLRLAAEVAYALGLPVGTPVCVGAGDGPLANLGSGATEPGVAGLSLGTSGALRVAVDGPSPDRHGSLFCYALADPLWVVGGATSNGADVLRWVGSTSGLDSLVAEDSDAVALELAAGVNAGSDGLVMLPFLLPERSPLWDPYLAGAFVGLRQDHTLAHQVRAGIEGVCMQMSLILDRLSSRYPIRCIRATGGAFRSQLWAELMAAALDRPLYIVSEAEGSALGAAVLGLVAIGEVSSYDDAFTALHCNGVDSASPVSCAPELVDAFRDIRSRVPDLLGSLARATSHARTIMTDSSRGGRC